MNKLKRPDGNSAIFPCERSVQLFSRVIRAFTPSEGSVVDPFAGPLTASIACMETGRSCTAISDHGDATKYAIGRLRILVTPNATMEHLAAYAEPLAGSSDSDNPSQKKRRTEGESATAADSDEPFVDGLRKDTEDDNHDETPPSSRTTRSSRRKQASQQAASTEQPSAKAIAKPSADPSTTTSEEPNPTPCEPDPEAEEEHTSCDLDDAKDLLSLHRSEPATPHEEEVEPHMVNFDQLADETEEFQEEPDSDGEDKSIATKEE